MNNQQVARRIRLSETRTSWEDQSSAEVAAGKLEVMEKFFTPLPHSTGRRTVKDRTREEASWEGIRDKYYKECISSSSRSTSSSPWSSESNFGVRERFSGYHVHATHSRSCNDLSVAKGRGNEEKRDFSAKQKNTSHIKKANRDRSDRLSPGIIKGGSNKKSHSGNLRDVGTNSKSEREDKKILKNGGRRAKSMEALAQKETRKSQGNGRRVTEEKQRFSRFLDEITTQVLSPSNLNSLGVKEKQSIGNREQWKNSSTDSSGSRGKRSQPSSAKDQQEVRRKGRTLSATRAKANVETPGLRKNRDMSTSPDSLSSSTWHRGERDDANLSASSLSHEPRKTSHNRLSHERGMKGRSLFEQMGTEKKQVFGGGGVIKGKTPYTDKLQNKATDKSSATPPTSQIQDTGLQSSTQNDNMEQDSLNWKITELLDHLVRAQSTICALEKLNVSSLLHHLPANMLESIKVSHQGPDGNIHAEDTQELKSLSVITSETSRLDISSSNLKYTGEDSKVEEQPVQRTTAFTPWSPRRQRSFPALHTLYTSTESDCSLEDVLPTFKLLSPRFPNLGESFSDDRKDDGNSDGCESRKEQIIPGDSKSSLALPSLLPTHRIPHLKHHSRASSSESSGDEQLIHFGELTSQEPPLDYISAQKILDSLLGLTTPTDRTNILNPEKVGEISRTDSNYMSSAMIGKNDFHPSERHSQPKSSLCSFHSTLHNPDDDSIRRLHPIESKIPLLPARGVSFPGSFTNACPLRSPVGEIGFRPVDKNESSTQHKSEGPLPPSSLPIPGQSVVPHSIPFVLRSPSGSESIMGTWDSQNLCQEGVRERKPRKARTVTFNTMNSEHQLNQSQATARSKFMSSKVGDQGQRDNQTVDSTLL